MGFDRSTIMRTYLDIDTDDLPTGSSQVEGRVVGDCVTHVEQRKHGRAEDRGTLMGAIPVSTIASGLTVQINS